MNQVGQFDLDPQVDLDIKGVLTPQVVVNFGSQVNIIPKRTWMKPGCPDLVKSNFYLKLLDQGLVESLGIWKYMKMIIMGILTIIDFDVIEPKTGYNSYIALVGRPWGRKMKANISLDENRIKIKGRRKKVIIPLDLREDKPWDEPDEYDKVFNDYIK